MNFLNIWICIKICALFIINRPFGSVIYDLGVKYRDRGEISVTKLRKLEKVSLKSRKAELDLRFLNNCKSLGVFPKFLCFHLPANSDAGSIRKQLLRSAIRSRSGIHKKLYNERVKLEKDVYSALNSIDAYILRRCIQHNIDKSIERTTRTHEKKLRYLTRNTTLPFTHHDTVFNLSSYRLTDQQLDILKNGLTYSICPPKLDRASVFTSFEQIHKTMVDHIKDTSLASSLKADVAHLAHSYVASFRPKDLHKHRVLKQLRNNKDIVILKPDKGNSVVILDKTIYNNGLYEIINDNTKFKRLQEDPTLAREDKLQRFLRGLKKKQCLTDDEYKDIYPCGSQPGRLYGLPKMHKHFEGNTPPFRPIVSTLGAYNYPLSKFLSKLLSPHLPDDYSLSDSFSFIEQLQNSSRPLNHGYMASLDVKSLFTNLPLNECIDLAIEYIFDNEPNLKINEHDLRLLFKYATAESHFRFDGHFYDQIDGIAMGSPLAPLLAGLFMGHHERQWIEQFPAGKLIFYRRYVDDIFCIFDDEASANQFFEFLNSCHVNIQFTIEKEAYSSLPFLDVQVSKDGDQLLTSVYRKRSYTGLLTNFYSFTSHSYKLGLIRCMIDRTYKLCSTWNQFHSKISELSHILQMNLFPCALIEKYVSRYLSKVMESNEIDNVKLPKKYFSIPYIGGFSGIAQKRLNKLVHRYCVDLNICLAFSSFKIGRLFSTKDILPKLSCSNVVYKFTCAGCGACYVGETRRHLNIRISEHFNSKGSNIYKHLHDSPRCKEVSSIGDFRVIDTARTDNQLKLKESLHIFWSKPSLNVQVHHVDLTLF